MKKITLKTIGERNIVTIDGVMIECETFRSALELIQRERENEKKENH